MVAEDQQFHDRTTVDCCIYRDDCFDRIMAPVKDRLLFKSLPSSAQRAALMQLPVIENCDNCGACCLQVLAPPFFINDERNEAIEKGVPDDQVQQIVALLFGTSTMERSPCLWYDPQTRGCRHYEQRPDDCRAFEIGSHLCRHHRRSAGIDQ